MANKPTFEQNMAHLDQIVKALEQGNLPLEDALTQFQEGVKLSQQLKATLQNAETKLTKVTDENGQEQSFDRDLGDDHGTN